MSTLCKQALIRVEPLEPRRLLASIPITNASFEDPSLADGQSSSSIPGWTLQVLPSDPAATNVSAVALNPTEAQLYDEALDGANVARIRFDGGNYLDQPVRLSQSLSSTLAAETSYTLKGLVGWATDTTGDGNGVLELLAGDTVVASGYFGLVSEDIGLQYEVTASYTSPASSSLIGQALKVRWTAGTGFTFTTGGDLTLDHVRLDATPLNPPAPTVNLAVAGVPDADKETVGQWVPINSNFDEQNFGPDGRPRHDNEPDASGHRINAGDQELRDVALTFGGDGSAGTWTLDFPSRIKVWKDTGGVWAEVVSGATQPSITAPFTVNLKIEGISLSDARNDIELKATFTPSGGAAVIDRARFSVAGVDIDIDSDNDNGFDLPDSDGDEGLLEGDASRPGKYLTVNDDDSDNDGIADYFDGFNLDGIPGNADDATPGEQFVPVLVQLPRPLVMSEARLRVIYPATRMEEMEGPTLDEGSLRLWARDGNVARSRANIFDGGDYISSADYTPDEMGIGSNDEFVFYVEAVRASTDLASRVIQLLCDPDGNSGPAPYELFDAVLVTATGDVTQVPATPSNVQAGVASTTQVNFDWNDVTGTGVSYQVHRSVAAGFTPDVGTLIATTNESRYVDDNVSSSGVYYYRIVAVINGVSSAPSVQLQANTSVTPPVPQAPTNLVAESLLVNLINLRWNDTSLNETGFIIERSVEGSGIWNSVAEVGTNATEFDDNDSQLQPNTTYNYRITAKNNGGFSFAEYAPPTTTPASAPSGVPQLHGTWEPGVFTLRWGDTGSVDGYRVERLQYSATNHTPTWQSVATLGATARKYVVQPAAGFMSLRVVAVSGGRTSLPFRTINAPGTAKATAVALLNEEEAKHTSELYYTKDINGSGRDGVRGLFDQLSMALENTAVAIDGGLGQNAEYHSELNQMLILPSATSLDVVHELVHAVDDVNDWYANTDFTTERPEMLAYTVEFILTELTNGAASLDKMDTGAFPTGPQAHWNNAWLRIDSVVGKSHDYDDQIPFTNPTHTITNADVTDVGSKLKFTFSANALLSAYNSLVESRMYPPNSLNNTFTFGLNACFA